MRSSHLTISAEFIQRSAVRKQTNRNFSRRFYRGNIVNQRDSKNAVCRSNLPATPADRMRDAHPILASRELYGITIYF